VDWFNQDGAVKLGDTEGAQEAMKRLRAVPHLSDGVAHISRGKGAEPGLWVSAAEFILEGLYALQKISRSEERGYHGTPKPERPPQEGELPERGRDRDPRRKRYMN
jgi:magnesium chelatase subunit I